MRLQRFYITFGQKYAREEHPVLPGAHPDNIIEIRAESYPGARFIAVMIFGIAWSALDPWDEGVIKAFYPAGVLATFTEGEPELGPVLAHYGAAAR